MADFSFAQQDLRRSAAFSHRKGGGVESPDIKELVIETLDPETGSVTETLSLQGTHLPRQPFQRSISQQVVKFYYAGGAANRVPTVQVLGSMDDDVTLTGRFKATKIRDTSRAKEPLQISQILERMTRQGSVCHVRLGPWDKYCIITNSSFEYKTDSDLDWSVTFSVIGDKNPITGAETEGNISEIARVFSSSEAEDFSNVAAQLTEELNQNRMDMEASRYIPPVTVTPFSVKGYLAGLLNQGAVGDLVATGRDIYNQYLEVIRTIDRVIDGVEDFSDLVDKTTQDIQKAILLMTSQISRLYRVQQELFASYTRIPSSVGTFSRLLAWNTIGNLLFFTHRLQKNYKVVEDSLRQQQATNIKKAYIVRPGDTYQSVATREYGSFDRWEELKGTEWV